MHRQSVFHCEYFAVMRYHDKEIRRRTMSAVTYYQMLMTANK